ncbi:chitooligosaccharidolytic beta-N-acetylglucosaminidase-like [Atheta coriaria]|uniref:chitooligosaccharidolytic beta-N-acetylglucosaminidase-like n=1 Tax=Dalotia coriaria TaxID=877792 RepID=UPI0031F3809F
MITRIALGVIIAGVCLSTVRCNDSEWAYECIKGYCQKVRLTEDNRDNAVSLGACRIFCSKYASLWPKPTGRVEVKRSLLQVNYNSIDVLTHKGDSPIRSIINGAAKRFKHNIELLKPKKSTLKAGGRSLIVMLEIEDSSSVKFLYNQDESYSLNVTQTSDGRINAQIKSRNLFGGRHAMETLNQLIFYDDLRDELQMPDDVYIEDAPIYPHRGILLDTSRNYVSTDVIKQTIEGMAASKLNVFHWHITDSHSFPYVSKSMPQLSKLGAYSREKIYTPEDVAEIIEFGKERGVMILPEFDAPAHVGEGWQDTGLLACFNKKPWQSYCVEPPCGQLDPTKPGVYDALEKIYKDMVEQFDPTVFHMGGDEVNENCWKSEDNIVSWMTERNMTIDDPGFMKLWDHFQSQALDRFTKQRGHKLPIIMWTSKLTSKDYLTKYLKNDTYIIQIWTLGNDPQIKELLKNGYRTILSNYDALYFDCGFAGWVTDGNNWCSPYIGWQKVYENSPAKIAGNKYKNLMMGAEATLWTEQADDTVIDSRLWPRAAAMAERLWSEPESTWKDAEERMEIHRERLVRLNIKSDAIQPQWCQQHQGSCPLDGVLN